MPSLILKAAAGFLFLMLSLALVLFLPAGSLAFWQAWLFLAVFGTCTVLITAYLARRDQGLLARRVSAGPAAETQRAQQAITLLANLLFLGLFIVCGLDFRFGWSQIAPALSLAAEGLVALGFGIVFLVFRENSHASAVIEVAQGQPVIASGPYGVVRHPMYAGAALLLLAAPVALGSWFGLPLALLLILAVAARLLAEERFLRASLPGYTEYCGRVRYRLVPYVW